MSSVDHFSCEIDIDDVEYLRHADAPLLARIYKPRGRGPFPLIVEVHGGAWCQYDRLHDSVMNEALARSGVVVAALDFRMPPDGAYPDDIADINYALRWLKQRAGELKSGPEMLGLMGCSSGGHQAMLTAMRPRDPRYTALLLSGEGSEIDASVRCVVLCWPVVDPLGRYDYAKKLQAGTQPCPPIIDRVIPCHDRYWRSREAMAEGSPALALERGERVELPPVLYLQGTADVAHPHADRERFVASYRKVGGRVDVQLYEGEGEAFMTKNPGSLSTQRALDKIISFVHAELR